MKPTWYLLALFAVILVLRLVVAFSEPLHYDAYEPLRHARSVAENGTPLMHDPLSYQGRMHFFSPVWAYVLGGFGALFPLDVVARILPNLLMASTVFFAFGIVRRITGSPGAALFGALCVGALPIGLIATATTASVTALTVFLVLLTSFFIVNTHRKRFAWYALASGAALVASTPLALVIVAGFVLYAVLSRLEDADTRKTIEEITLVWLVFGLWYYALLFKQAFQDKGFAVLWDMPVSLLAQWFGDVTFVQVLLAIGFVSVVLGMFAAYHAFFERRQPFTLLFVSLLLVLVPALLFKVIRGQVGLMYIGAVCAILAGVAANIAYQYLAQTKIAAARPFLVAGLLVVFAITVVAGMSFYGNDAPTAADRAAAEHLASVDRGASIVARPREGAYLMYVTSHKTIIDRDFLMAPDAQDRLIAVETIFTNPFGVPVARALDDFDVDYVFLSEGTQAQYNITDILGGGECLSLVYDERAKIYQNTCRS